MLNIKDYYDAETGTFSYLVYDRASSECVIIDPVLQYDMISGHISEICIAEIVADINALNLNLTWVLETHAHADHLTAAQQLKEQFNAKIGIGNGITDIQNHFKEIYGFDDSFDVTGRAFDGLFKDGDIIPLGNYQIEVLETPGHTPDSISYRIDNYLFIGDTLFHPTIGTARCDFPGGDARELFTTVTKIMAFPDETVLCLCHDYPEADRKAQAFITVSEMRDNSHLVQSDYEVAQFVEIRRTRDASLELPKLIIPSIQTNTQAGINKGKMNQPLRWPINRF